VEEAVEADGSDQGSGRGTGTRPDGQRDVDRLGDVARADRNLGLGRRDWKGVGREARAGERLDPIQDAARGRRRRCSMFRGPVEPNGEQRRRAGLRDSCTPGHAGRFGREKRVRRRLVRCGVGTHVAEVDLRRGRKRRGLLTGLGLAERVRVERGTARGLADAAAQLLVDGVASIAPRSADTSSERPSMREPPGLTRPTRTQPLRGRGQHPSRRSPPARRLGDVRLPVAERCVRRSARAARPGARSAPIIAAGSMRRRRRRTSTEQVDRHPLRRTDLPVVPVEELRDRRDERGRVVAVAANAGRRRVEEELRW
jgi:hypothetical protein